MSLKTLPVILKESAAGIVDQVANDVLDAMATYPHPPSAKPFCNRIVRIVNSPDLVTRPMSDVERAAVREMIEDSKQIRQRARLQRRKLQEMQRQFDFEMQQIETQEHREAQAKLKETEQKREAERQKRAEIALMNIAKRKQMRQEEKERLRRARDLVRRSSKSILKPPAPGSTEMRSKSSVTKKNVTLDPVARDRWTHFVRRYRRTKWFKTMEKEIATLANEKRRAREDLCARLIRRRDYGAVVRARHAPNPSAKLQDQLLARIDQLQHPDYVRQKRDVRSKHPVVGGKPGTEVPVLEPPFSTAKKYTNYLQVLHRLRIQNGPDEFRHLSKADLQEKIQVLERDIQEREQSSHRPDVTAGHLADDLARLSQSYLKALRAKSQLCDLYEAEHLFADT